MLTTEQDYNEIANKVYYVDSGKTASPVVTGDKILNKKFIVIKSVDNVKTDIDNGMQAMAVAPVDKNGKVDYSEVVIAYAGTNSGDIRDIETDIQSIGLGGRQLKYRTGVNTAKVTESQFTTALGFAKQVEKEVKKKYPNAVITTTGHSLGQSLAMYVGLKQNYANVGYNGPDIHRMISDKEIKYMQEHSEQFRNYRNPHDDIGNILGDKTKTAIYPKVTKGKDSIKNVISDHLLATWQFTKVGQLKDIGGKVVTDKRISAYALTIASMAGIDAKRKQLAKGGYSNREQIFLDTIQSSVVAEGMAAVAQAGADDVDQVVKEGVEKSNSLWEAIDFNAFQELSYDEVLSIFADQGATYESIVMETQTILEAGKIRTDTKAEEFLTLKEQIDNMIQEFIATDKYLAEDIGNWIK